MFHVPPKGPSGRGSCRIKISGYYNVQRLRRHLRRFGLETSAPVQLDGTANYIVRIAGVGSRFQLRQLIAGFHYVEVYV